MVLALPNRTEILSRKTTRVAAPSKERDAEIVRRKGSIDIPAFVAAILYWQSERSAMKESDQDVASLAILTLGEIIEVYNQRKIEGLPGYSFVSEKGEVMDVGFFLSIFAGLLQERGESIDHQDILLYANGQSGGSGFFEKMNGVVGNMSEKSLEKDLERALILWVSYMINMKFPVNPNRVLAEYTFPKNNGNWPREIFDRNESWDMAFNIKMSPAEMHAHYDHAKEAIKIIRKFIKMYVDPNIGDTGLRPEHYRPYRLFIDNFIRFRDVGIEPEKALLMLRKQLFADYADEVREVGGPQKEEILIARH